MSRAAVAAAPLAAAAPTITTHWPAVLAAAFTGVAIAVNIGKLPLALPLLRSELGLSLVQAGWVGAMMNALAMGTALAVGLAAGRLGAFRMVMAGLGLSALASLLGLGVGLASSTPASHFAWLLATTTAAITGVPRQWSSARWVVAGAAILSLALGQWVWRVERRAAPA